MIFLSFRVRYPSPSENNSTYQHSHEKSKTRLCRALPRRILGCSHDKSTLRELAPVNKGHVYQTVYLHHVLDALALGAEYDFDTPAFNVLKEHIDLNKLTHHVLDEAEPTFHRVKLAN